MPYQIGEPIVPQSFKDLKNVTSTDLFLSLCSLYGYREGVVGDVEKYEPISLGFNLFRDMVTENDTIWLGIAGIGIVEGQGGFICDLIEKGFIDVICSTGAQVYHDLHFAFGLPINRINPEVDDAELRKDGWTRIYDAVIREEETLMKQDSIVQDFILKYRKRLTRTDISSATFNRLLGEYVLQNAQHPERSFVAACAKNQVPLFWDSMQNHSIAMNLAKLFLDEINVRLSAQLDILQSAAIVYSSPVTGFVELGGGGPKNFIQQTSPTISQILGIRWEGADRGLQITTADVKDGGLSGCTFFEGVTWGKYKDCDETRLVQIKGDYRVIFPLIELPVYRECEARTLKRIAEPHKMRRIYKKLIRDSRQSK